MNGDIEGMAQIWSVTCDDQATPITMFSPLDKAAACSFTKRLFRSMEFNQSTSKALKIPFRFHIQFQCREFPRGLHLGICRSKIAMKVVFSVHSSFQLSVSISDAFCFPLLLTRQKTKTDSVSKNGAF